jgi:uncharacterized protein YciI
MGTYIVRFTDNSDRAEARDRLMPEHLRFLEAHGHSIKAAGPLRDETTGEPAGGLWLVEAAQREEVDALVRQDPFWPTGLRKEVTILLWNKVFADGRRLI